MSAHDHVKALLDQLMGTGRDGDKKSAVLFTDPSVCRAFLTGLCPHDLFTNTKMDVGECPKTHDLALRADYEKASETKDYEYEIDALEQLESFIRDCDKKIQIAKRRLAETQTDLAYNSKPQSLMKLEGQISEKLKLVESLGAEGKVDESMDKLAELEALKQDARKEEESWLSTLPASAMQQQKLRVCDVCAAYLGLFDNDQRLADHFGGKLHMGFLNVRKRLQELRDIVEKKQNERDGKRYSCRTTYDGNKAKSTVGDRKGRHHSRERDDSSEKDSRRRHSRSRSRSRERRHHKSRGRSSTYHHNHDSHRLHRSRESSRSRSYDKYKHEKRRKKRGKHKSRSRSPVARY